MDRFDTRCRASLVIRLPSDSPFIGKVQSIDYDAKRGLIIADPVEKHVIQVDTLGRAIQVFGTAGDGPGEFRDPIDAVWLTNHRLLVLDRYRGLVLFKDNGEVLRDPFGPRFAGGTHLNRLTDSSALLGILDHATRGFSDFPPMARIIDLKSGLDSVSFAPEDRRATFPIRFVRNVYVAATPSGSRIAVIVPYRLGVRFYGSDGALIDSVEDKSTHYRPPVQPPRTFGGEGGFYRWARSFSHLFFVSLPESSNALLGWETFDDNERHYYLGVYSQDALHLVSVDEVPYRPMRGHGDSLVFLNWTEQAQDSVIVCRGWTGS